MRITDARERVSRHLSAGIAVKQLVAEQCTEPILGAGELLVTAFRGGGKLLLCGNGGSAADCQHTAAEFVGRLTRDSHRPGLPAIALTTDTSFLTAHSNDADFEGVFSRQVEALGKPGDVLLGISTSGNSLNVIRAMESARRCKLRTIALTGRGGTLAGMADVGIAVPSKDTQCIQEAHLAIEHILCDLVEHALFDPEVPPVDHRNEIIERMYGRRLAGVNTRVRVGVGIVVRDEGGRILLEQRSDCGWWGLPGGRIEPGESVEAAAVREMKEETGLTIRVARLLGVYSDSSERIVTYPDNGDGVQLVDILLEGVVVSGTLTLSSESLDLQFFDVDHLPSEIVPPARTPLQDAAEGRVGVIR